MPKPIISVLTRAARAGAHVMMRAIPKLDSVEIVEKTRHDYASDVDSDVEKEIVRELRRVHPDYGVLGEESGMRSGGRMTFVIDPIDGTSNFLRGIPHYCVSIALLDRGLPIAGVIFDPNRNELFHASRGDGAFVNERRMRVTARETLDGALIATGFTPRERSHAPSQLRAVAGLLSQAEDIRRGGSAALDLAYTACGRVDAYFEAGVKSWDISAGMLIVREAGGRVADYAGRDATPESGQVVAGNIKVVAAMLATFEGSGYAAAYR